MSSEHGGRGLDRWRPSLNMLGALMLNRVGGEVHGIDIVTVGKGAPRR
jgi:hypothetical protein